MSETRPSETKPSDAPGTVPDPGRGTDSEAEPPSDRHDRAASGDGPAIPWKSLLAVALVAAVAFVAVHAYSSRTARSGAGAGPSFVPWDLAEADEIPSETIRRAIEELSREIAQEPLEEHEPLEETVLDDVRWFYGARNHRPYWLADLVDSDVGAEPAGDGDSDLADRVARRAFEALEVCRPSIHAEALRPKRLRRALGLVDDAPVSGATLAALEVRLSGAFFECARELHSTSKPPPEIVWKMESTVKLVPLHALRETRERLGDDADPFHVMAEALGHLAAEHPQARRLHRAAEEAVARMEAGEEGAAEEVRRLGLNLLRSRWLPAPGDGTEVWINIPAFRLWVLENGRPTLGMNIVVGERDWPTVVFEDRIEYLVIHPHWNVPASIVAADLASKFREDPQAMQAEGFRIYSSWEEDAKRVDPGEIDWAEVNKGTFVHHVRQVSGPANPLGRIKFMMPNEDDIYLHDTPAQSLFAEPERARSHGCIRLGEPLELARTLYPSHWHEIRRLVAAGQRAVVGVDREVPVRIVYMTAWVDGDGTVHFYDDVYDRDERLRAELR